MHVGSICARSLVTCRRDATVAELARQMRDAHVGEVIVVEKKKDRICPVGVVTDRDIVVRVTATDLDPNRTTAGDLMLDPCETVFDSEMVYDAIWHMRGKHLRHLPVVDEHGGLIGLLRADGVSEFLASEMMEVARIAPHHVEVTGSECTPPAMSHHTAVARGSLPA